MRRPLHTILLLSVVGLATACNDATTPNTLITARPLAGSLAASQVSAGYDYACASATGGVYCWGANGSGQLGDGTWADRAEPVLVTGGDTFTRVGADGEDHTCALDADGAAWCWGYNGAGELGVPIDSASKINQPVRVATDQRFTQVVTGWDHSCGLTTGGVVYCWGTRGTTGVGPGGSDFDVMPPTRTLLDGRFVQISSQKWHTCALRDTGDLFCWGFSHAAELGGGEPYGYVDTPVQVSGGHQWVTVDVGRSSPAA
jgi:alpha-tubulin suppressor-like RCC1 family protein